MISHWFTASRMTGRFASLQAVIFVFLAGLATWLLAQFPSVFPAWIAPEGRLRISSALLGAVAFLAALTLVVEFTHRILETHGANRYLGYSKNAMLLSSLPNMLLLRSWFFGFALLCTLAVPATLWLLRQLWTDKLHWLEAYIASWWTVSYAFVALALTSGVVGIFRMTVQKPHVLMWKQQDPTIKEQIAHYFRQTLGHRAANAIRQGKLREWVQKADNWAAQVQPQEDAKRVVQEAIKGLERKHLLLKTDSFWKRLDKLPSDEQERRIWDLHSYVEYTWCGLDATARVDDGRRKLGEGVAAANRHATILGQARNRFSAETSRWTSSAMSRTRPPNETPTLDTCDAKDLGNFILRQAAKTVVRAQESETMPGWRTHSLEGIVRESGIAEEESVKRQTAALLLDAIEQTDASKLAKDLRSDLRRYLLSIEAGSLAAVGTGVSDSPGVFWHHLTRDQENCAPYALEVGIAGLGAHYIVLGALFEYLACENRHSSCECVERFEVWRSNISQKWSRDRPMLPTGTEAYGILRKTPIHYYLPPAHELDGLFQALSRPTSGSGLCGDAPSERVPVIGGRHFLLLKMLADETCSGVSTEVCWPFFSNSPTNEFEVSRRGSALVEYLTWMTDFSPITIPSGLSRVKAAIEEEQYRLKLFHEETRRPESEVAARRRGTSRQVRISPSRVLRVGTRKRQIRE
ncbi:hypothetical protein G7067_07585 [Leucobacter insecticola]|uniref:Uncharacterized protein n=1 Tax=Leucobacter insecticola TaxID=2714934 RepID=A0A6G8FIL1_9MICO|nr:hypothetical protein [Leucobacter insecticola]QIM16316.1 hypothetical protein G7067_07585 [Leucobacter insecticola]